ncbi:hypothetical protein N9D31_01080 [Oligoflexaceae bacterium]|nr:hypothetical protein [Oligoflexaceae bacterium]
MNRFLRKLTLWLSLTAATVSATELHEIYYGARPYGMGNAYTAIASDEYAVFTNPAGITRARKNRSRKKMHLFKFPNLTFGANSSQNQILDLQNGDETTEELISESGGEGGDPMWIFGGIYPVGIFELSPQSVVAVGALMSGRGFVLIDPDSPQNTTVESTLDTAGVLSLGISNRNNRFNVGVTLRPTQRYAYEDTIPTVELSQPSLVQERVAFDSRSMSGLGVDVGSMFTFSDFWFPTLGFSILNFPTGCKANFLNPYSSKEETICGTVFEPGTPFVQDNQPLSSIDPTDIRLGFSITPRLSRKIALRLALDVHHLPIQIGDSQLGYSGVEPVRLLHAGAELFAGNPLERNNWAVRIGANQGYYTMGATMKFSLFAFEFATFGQDISTNSKGNEDRRFIGNFSIEF